MAKLYYLALHEEGLKNGSFFRVYPKRKHQNVAQYMNGDFMGYREEIPTTYGDQPLREFTKREAERLIPNA